MRYLHDRLVVYMPGPDHLFLEPVMAQDHHVGLMFHSPVRDLPACLMHQILQDPVPLVRKLSDPPGLLLSITPLRF